MVNNDHKIVIFVTLLHYCFFEFSSHSDDTLHWIRGRNINDNCKRKPKKTISKSMIKYISEFGRAQFGRITFKWGICCNEIANETTNLMIKASATFLWDWMKERWTSMKYILANLNGMLYINQYQCLQFFIWFFALRASINTVQFWLCFGPSLPLQLIRLNDKRAKWREKKTIQNCSLTKLLLLRTFL